MMRSFTGTQSSITGLGFRAAHKSDRNHRLCPGMNWTILLCMKIVERGQVTRRHFIAVSAGAVAATRMLSAAESQGIPWWAARPGKAGVGQPSAIDMHAHWSPEPYNKALAGLGQPVAANPYPLDYDLDKRRQWMDDAWRPDALSDALGRHAVAKNFRTGWRASRARSSTTPAFKSTRNIPTAMSSAASCRSAIPNSR